MLTPEMAILVFQTKHAGLVDLDVTALVSFFLFFLLFFILNKTVFQPYLEILAEREKKIEGEQLRAQEITARAEKSFTEYQHQLADARSEASKIREALRREGQTEETTILEKARENASVTIKKGQESVSKQVREASLAVDEKALTLSKAIVSRILSRA